MNMWVLLPWRHKVRILKRVGFLFLGSSIMLLIYHEFLDTSLLESEREDEYFLTKRWSYISPSPKVPTVKYQYAGKLLQYKHGVWTKQPQNCYLKHGEDHEGKLKYSSNASLFVHHPKDDQWISKSILSTNQWKGNLSAQINEILMKDKERVFIDIGAHVGVFSIPAAFLGNHVIAIDCVKDTLKKLCSSVRKNKLLDRVTLIHNAVWRDNRYATLKFSPKNIGGVKVESVHDVPEPSSKTKDVVPTVTLNNLLDLFQLSKVVIKMSVEGDELTIMQGADRFFKEVQVDYVIMEFTNHRRELSALHMRSMLRTYNMVPMVTDAMLKEKTYVRWPSTVIWRRM